MLKTPWRRTTSIALGLAVVGWVLYSSWLIYCSVTAPSRQVGGAFEGQELDCKVPNSLAVTWAIVNIASLFLAGRELLRRKTRGKSEAAILATVLVTEALLSVWAAYILWAWVAELLG